MPIQGGSGFTYNPYNPPRVPGQTARKKLSVVFLDNWVSVCYGCRKKFPRNASEKILPPPLGIILECKETREYYTKMER